VLTSGITSGLCAGNARSVFVSVEFVSGNVIVVHTTLTVVVHLPQLHNARYISHSMGATARAALQAAPYGPGR
jgi:hypothetical protein